MALDAHQAYRDGEILQADPVQLVRLLYRGAIQAVARARQHVRNREIKERSRQITKAAEIVAELIGTLDLERGGELAKSLLRLYEYVQFLLQTANFEQAEAPLAEAEKLLGVLAEAWEECRVESAPRVPGPLLADPTGDFGSSYSPRAFLG